MLGLIQEWIYKLRQEDNREYFLDSQIKESIIRFQKVSREALITSTELEKSILEIQRMLVW